jgi:diguanylate cyclase (GGDEF)-like protein
MPDRQARRVEDLRQEALDAARGLERGESALVGVLRDLEQERSRAAQAYRAVVRSLAAALEARDGYTGEHSDAVHALSVAVARKLGLYPREVAEVEAVALLHDVGKIGIPDQILHKPGPLTPEEWVLMREHPVIGERILRPLPGLSEVATAVRHEHERWDGRGYPDGISGEDIPLASRIVLACDAYNALVSDRPYRRRLSDATAEAELRRCAGTQFDPRVVYALLECIAEGVEEAPGEGTAEDLARALTEHADMGEERRLERELHALISIASAVAAAHRLEDVVEVAAEEALSAIEAASLSISRWEVERRHLRTLVNVGELGPSEERRPVDEVYRLENDDLLRGLLERGETYTTSLDDPGIIPVERDLLVAHGKHHAIAVPVLFAGEPWGELWATRRAGEPQFGERDIRFLQTVTGQIAAAVGRAELFSRMAELAFEDPLTGVANRRALDERLEVAIGEAVDAGRDLAVLLCDVDNLKELNDAHGHGTGDASLARVAGTLTAAAGDDPRALVARVGGDEFCVLLDGRSAEDARLLGETVLAELAKAPGPRLTVSCGVASIGLGARRGGDLLRAADAAQYTAKRTGRNRVCVSDASLEQTWRAGRSERRAIRGRRHDAALDLGRLLDEALDALDGPLAARSALDRLEAVALGCSAAIDASATVVSYRPAGSDLIDTVFANDARTSRTSGQRFGVLGETYESSKYPATERILANGGSFVVLTDDASADAAERALLAEWGMAGVAAAAAVQDGEGAWLIELYADGATLALHAIEAPLRLLVGEAVRSAGDNAALRLAS